MAGVQQLLLVLVLLVQGLRWQVLCVVCVFVLCDCEFGLEMYFAEKKRSKAKNFLARSLGRFEGNFAASRSDQHHTHTHERDRQLCRHKKLYVYKNMRYC